MLKLVIHIECDSCKETFIFGRASACTADALQFNTNVLSAMLPHHWWQCKATEQRTYHYCPECCHQFVELEEQTSSVT
jgi:hypothetical protein